MQNSAGEKKHLQSLRLPLVLLHFNWSNSNRQTKKQTTFNVKRRRSVRSEIRQRHNEREFHSCLVRQASSLAIDKLLVRNRHEFTELNLTHRLLLPFLSELLDRSRRKEEEMRSLQVGVFLVAVAACFAGANDK